MYPNCFIKSQIRKNAEIKEQEVDNQLKNEIPEFESIFEAERYDEFLRMEQEKDRLDREQRKNTEKSHYEHDEGDCISYKIGQPFDKQKEEANKEVIFSNTESEGDDSNYTLSDDHDDEDDAKKVAELLEKKLRLDTEEGQKINEESSKKEHTSEIESSETEEEN